MTTLDLNFALSPTTIYFSAVGAPMSGTALASNITSVSFAKGQGQIIYNDRPGLPELFSDPSPYQSYLDAWLTEMESVTPALTLAQAQAVKVALLGGIYAVKRQAAVAVSVGATSYNWDASDEACARMSALSGFLVGQNGVLKQLVTDLNVWATHFNSHGTTTQNAFNALVSEINAAFASMGTSGPINSLDNVQSGVSGSGGAGVTDWGIVWLKPSVSAVSAAFSSDSALTESFSSAAAASVQLIPVGATAPVTLALSDLQNILTAIATQNIATQETYLTKQAAINALSTIADVAAYDATSGW